MTFESDLPRIPGRHDLGPASGFMPDDEPRPDTADPVSDDGDPQSDEPGGGTDGEPVVLLFMVVDIDVLDLFGTVPGCGNPLCPVHGTLGFGRGGILV